IALCPALRRKDWSPARGDQDKSRLLPMLVAVPVAIITRTGPPAVTAPAAAPRPATPHPAANVRDILSQVGPVDRGRDPSRHRDRHGLGAIRYRSGRKNGKRGGSRKYNPAHCFLHP